MVAIIYVALTLALEGFLLGLTTARIATVFTILSVGGTTALCVALSAWSIRRHRRSFRAIGQPEKSSSAHSAGLMLGSAEIVLPDGGRGADGLWSTPSFRSAMLIVAVAWAIGFSLLGRVSGEALGPSSTNITGAPGYATFRGPHGKAMAVGQPWGTACEPVVFSLAPGATQEMTAEFEQQIHAARADGIDVTIEDAAGDWVPSTLYPTGLTNSDVRFVNVFPSTATPPTLPNQKALVIKFAWNAELASNSSHEYLTVLQATVYLQAWDSQPAATVHAIHRLVGFSLGIDSSTLSGSGLGVLSDNPALTQSDMAALQLMSGCNFNSERIPPPV